MNHKKALKKILKWAGSLLLSSLFTAPVIFILIICGVVIALFGKSSTSSGDVSFSETVSVSETAVAVCEFFSNAGYTDIQIAAILGNLEWESRLDYNSFTQLKKGGTAMGIAQWTTYSGTNSLVRYADSMGMEWNDLELQCMAIDATLHNQNPYSGWYDTGMGKYYGVTKADFWEGDLYEATIAFFCCFEDPEEYPDGCNNHGYTSPAVYRCRLIVAMVTAACRMRKCILITWKAVTWEAIPVVTKRKVNQRKILYQRNHLAEWKFRYICREIMHQSHGEIRLWQSQDVGLPVWQW